MMIKGFVFRYAQINFCEIYVKTNNMRNNVVETLEYHLIL